MTWGPRTRLSLLALVVLAAHCENKESGGGQAAPPASAAPSSTASAAPSASAAPVASGSSASTASTAPAASASVLLPERPIPRPQTRVGAGMPVEVQQKAVAYMVAMGAPRPGDANADPDFAQALGEKLRPILLSMDTGADKGRFDRVEVSPSGRQIDLLMAGGCDEKTPWRAVAQRAGMQLATLAAHGVFVVRCNDVRIQCLQSTRDPDDVLCTTAPRHR